MRKEKETVEKEKKDQRSLGTRFDEAKARAKRAESRLERASEALTKASAEVAMAKQVAEGAAAVVARLQEEELAGSDPAHPATPKEPPASGGAVQEGLREAAEPAIEAASTTWLPPGTRTTEDGRPAHHSDALGSAQRASSRPRSPSERGAERTFKAVKAEEDSEEEEDTDPVDLTGEVSPPATQPSPPRVASHGVDLAELDDSAASVVDGLLAQVAATNPVYAAAAKVRLTRRGRYLWR